MIFSSKKKRKPENIASMVMTHIRDYGENNPKGELFDRVFNGEDFNRNIARSRNSIGQGVQQMMYPNGLSPDGFSTYMPTIMINDGQIDPTKVQDTIAENQVQLYWRNNVERMLKYNIIATRSEVNESLTQICNEAIYKDDKGDICSLHVNEYSEIAEVTKMSLQTIFKRDVLRKICNFKYTAWQYMKKMLTEGRIFLEVVYDEVTNEIVGLNLLPGENMIVIVQDNLIIGYRQMLTGTYAHTSKNYIDYSPNQILFLSLDLYGPGGVNDPRSILEPAVKAHNQLNTIEDSVVMYRVLWGSEKMVLKVDIAGQPKPQAEATMKEQAKMFSRQIDYNSTTGEITNWGKAIGLTEHFIIPVQGGSSGSSIERLQGGDQLGNIDDLKFFKRNLINALMVPPGRITALAGDSVNYSNGKIGEVTQAEVAFARLVDRYQTPFEQGLVRLFIMVLNTRKEFSDQIKVEENFDIKFKRSNGFQSYIDADVWTTRLSVFGSMMEYAVKDEAPNNPLSQEYCLRYGLGISDADLTLNRKWREHEQKILLGEESDVDSGEGGGIDEFGGGGGGMAPAPETGAF